MAELNMAMMVFMDQKIVYIIYIYICLSMVVEKERKHKLQSSKKSYSFFSHHDVDEV